MADSGLTGPFSLTEDSIAKNVTKTSPGAYVLGKTKENTFYISYVGRSDDDVADRIRDHIGEYDQFKYGYYPSAKSAFEKECRLYHDFGGSDKLDNKVHPARPKNTSYPCPVSGCRELL